MLEREFEILVRLCTADIFPKDWRLIAQQLTLPSGRLDMLYADSKDIRQLVELKKGRAKIESVDQVVAYAQDLKILLDDTNVTPWVAAHEIPPDVKEYARKYGAETIEISTSDCQELITKHHLSEADLLGVRREKGVLHGGYGKGGVRNIIDNQEVYKTLPQEVAKVLGSIEIQPNFNVRSGSMQTVVHYRGVKLGGYNRVDRGGHAYISEGVVLNDDMMNQLSKLGFHKMRKTQKTSNHEHIWWEISSKYIEQFSKAVDAAKNVVDRSLLIK